MGLIKAAVGAAGGVLADSWKEMIYCDALDKEVLAAKGQKRTSKRSSNVHGDDNIITNGSRIIVNDGQAMVIVDQGAIVDFCTEPGEYTYDTSSEPSFFGGDLSESITQMFEKIGGRFAFGGDTGHDQRVYYFNTKEIMGNKFGTATPVPFRVVDNNIGLDVDISIRCNGLYSYKITNPLLFYKNVAGNVEDVFTRSQIDAQLKSELITALQPAFAQISGMGIRYSALLAHTLELTQTLNNQLSETWRNQRGIEMVRVGINSISASPEDEQMIKDLQKSATMRDPSMRAAALAGAQADAMRAAASNSAGAMTGFMGLNMAGTAGMGAQQNFAQVPGQVPANQYQTSANGGFNATEPAETSGTAPSTNATSQSASSWICTNCGATNTGKFCSECGTPRPAAPQTWTCTNCGATNTGKFCSECGAPRP